MAASIKYAIAWIAENDNSGSYDSEQIISQYTTVALVADIFDKSTDDIARRVYAYRLATNGRLSVDS